MKVIIASKNPVKINAAEQAFNAMFPDESFEFEGVSVESGVPDQPMSDEETYRGAVNRIDNAHKASPDADYWVGMEGGLQETGDELEAFAWMVVKGKNGKYGKGRSATFFLPPRVAELVREGNELSDATDIVFDEYESGKKQGSIGILTYGNIDRTRYYLDPMIIALIPFKNTDLY